MHGFDCERHVASPRDPNPRLLLQLPLLCDLLTSREFESRTLAAFTGFPTETEGVFIPNTRWVGLHGPQPWWPAA